MQRFRLRTNSGSSAKRGRSAGTYRGVSGGMPIQAATCWSSHAPNLGQHRSGSGTLLEHWVSEQPSAWAQVRQA
jgi:hypothetical protein